MTRQSLLLSAMVSVSLSLLGCAETKEAANGPKSPTSQMAKGQGRGGLPDSISGAALGGGGDSTGPGVDSAGLHVSQQIVDACGMPRQDYAPAFGFDSADITDEDRDLLNALAKCLSDGALKENRVTLVGRADPRGEDEYNMVLGGARAESVRRYLNGLGVGRERVLATSRGELDATGQDEPGWTRDRRVDIQLAGNDK
jgi:peptidoglycan-associated lipoprotein